ncbi:MAG: phospholipase D-like domain-containing protein [Algoriphagus sp.]|nr:phospholipase D-like domain-containing protein [Algoriphagus sp.]
MHQEIYFSSESNLRDIILEHIELAVDSIHIAVAWFTEPKIFKSLMEKLAQGVNVEVIVTNHQFNRDSRNDFEALNRGGGFFATCGNDDSLMHNKFCIIDHNYVLNGSFNYTKKANSSNQENLNVVSGDPIYASRFHQEFQKLKELSGFQKIFEEELTLSECVKTLTAIRTFIQIGEVKYIFSLANKIKEEDRVKHIYDLIMLKEYEKALEMINVFLREYSQVITIGAFERDYLKTQIRLISAEILLLESEKVELENKVEEFNHRYTIELFPLIIKILALKKKINEKLKKYQVHSTEFEEAELQYDKAVAELDEELENIIPELTVNEADELKRLHREAAKYCHPDSSERKIENVDAASKIFSELTEAYHRKDLERVRYICFKLRQGESLDELDSISELEVLSAKLQTLKSKLDVLLREIYKIKSSQEYRIIVSDDLETYFAERKQELIDNYKELVSKYAKNEGK